MWQTIGKTILLTFTVLIVVTANDSSDEDGVVDLKKRLGARMFRRPWAIADGYKRADGFDSDYFDTDKRGGGRFINVDQLPYVVQKRPGARFLGGGSGYGGYYGSYPKRPWRRYYRSVDTADDSSTMERAKKPGGRFISFVNGNGGYGRRYGKRTHYDDDFTHQESRQKRSRYGYPSWLRYGG